MASLARVPAPRGSCSRRPTRRRSPSGRLFRFHLRAFASEEAAARRGEVEPVHQLRVATRRLARRCGSSSRCCRSASPPACDASSPGWPTRSGPFATRRAVRGGRVARRQARSRGPTEPRSAGGRHPRPARRGPREARQDARLRARAALFDRLAAFAESAARREGEPLGAVAPHIIRPLLRAVLRAGRAVGTDATPEVLHRLRIRTKRLRYALETLHGLGGKAVKKTVARLEALQDLLGTHQDAATQVAWLPRVRAWPPTSRPPRSSPSAP